VEFFTPLTQATIKYVAAANWDCGTPRYVSRVDRLLAQNDDARVSDTKP
jgi:hypothetical protein